MFSFLKNIIMTKNKKGKPTTLMTEELAKAQEDIKKESEQIKKANEIIKKQEAIIKILDEMKETLKNK